MMLIRFASFDNKWHNLQNSGKQTKEKGCEWSQIKESIITKVYFIVTQDQL